MRGGGRADIRKALKNQAFAGSVPKHMSPKIQAHLQALSASPGRPNHAATGLIRRQTNYKAVEINRRERDGRFQLLYLGLSFFLALLLALLDVLTSRRRDRALLRR